MNRSRSTSWLGEADLDTTPSPAVLLGRGKPEERQQLLHRPRISGGAVAEHISPSLLVASRAASAQAILISRLQGALFSRLAETTTTTSASASASGISLPLTTLVLNASVGLCMPSMSMDVIQEMARQMNCLFSNCLLSNCPVRIDLASGGFTWRCFPSGSLGQFGGADPPIIDDENLDDMLLIIWEAMMASIEAPDYLVPHPVAIVPCSVAGLIAILARAHDLYWGHVTEEKPVDPNTSATLVKKPGILPKKPMASEKRIDLKKPTSTSTSKVLQERRMLNIHPSPERVSTNVVSISSEASGEEITPPDATDTLVSSGPESFMADVETLPCASQIVESKMGFPEHVVVTFVEELERAHQYYLFKEHLRTNCAILTHASFADDISYELTWQNELSQEFPLVEEDDVYHVVHKYILELEAEHWKVENNAQGKDLYAINNAIHYLLFRTREEGYVLDEKPEKELEKLRRFAPLTYSECSVPRKPPVDVEARTAIVSNIALEVTNKDIRLFLGSFGCIKKFTVERNVEDQVAQVTYKDLKGVAKLKAYKGFELPYLSKRTESGYAPLGVHVSSVADANRLIKVEDIGELYAEALVKYNAIRTYCYRFMPEDGQARDKEEWWGSCQWMAMESWANGGYTVCGKYMRRPGTRGTPVKRRLRVNGMGGLGRRLGSRVMPVVEATTA